MSARIVGSLFLIAMGSVAIAATTFQAGTYTLGNMALIFAEHGKLELRVKDEVVMNGTWKSDGTHLTVTDQSGSYACAAPVATGVYRWQASGDTLTMIKEKDACDDRSQALDGKSWKHKS